MGYKTEINYIAKMSHDSEMKQLLSHDLFLFRQNYSPDEMKQKLIENEVTLQIEKEGMRTYALNSPLFLANPAWDIIGMCLVIGIEIKNDKTIAHCRVIDLYDTVRVKIATDFVQDGEKQKAKLGIK